MENLPIGKAFTLIEPGPVVLVTTNDGRKDNVMAISWTMVLDFTAKFAITTGAWNYSYAALTKTKECVIAIPTVDLLDTVVGVGTCSGKDTDKFAKFGLTRVKARHVRAPLIAECLGLPKEVGGEIVDAPHAHIAVPLQKLRDVLFYVLAQVGRERHIVLLSAAAAREEIRGKQLYVIP